MTGNPGMVGDPTLFAGYGPTQAEKLSADRRRTARQHRDVERGIHPLTRGPTRPDLGICGTCRFRDSLGHHARSYPKCTWPSGYDRSAHVVIGAIGEPGGSLPDPWPRANHSASTDVRAWWPACSDWEPKR